jgi:hypothetical protein
MTLAFCLVAPLAAQAAGTAQVSQLQDVTFTSLDPMSSASRSMNLCVFSSSTGALYSVSAHGDGAGGAFTLSAGGSIPVLPYSVLWAATSGQTTGTALSPNQPLANQTSSALNLLCLAGIGTSASLTIGLATSDLQQATSGVTYTGVLTVTVTAQ